MMCVAQSGVGSVARYSVLQQDWDPVELLGMADFLITKKCQILQAQFRISLKSLLSFELLLVL